MVYLTIPVLLIAISGPAHAYVDPGSGSYMLQMALTGILAAAFSAKLYWQRIKTAVVQVFSGRNGTSEAA